MTTPTQIRDDVFAALEPALVGLRLDVFAALQAHGPCTTRQLAEKTGISILTVRPRVHELVDLGLAECSGRDGREGVYRALTIDEARRARDTAIEAIQGTQTELFRVDTRNAYSR
jgi:DNA-binding IclR family transcriptional regulator